mmetsp:Transcript_14308/g.19418  ORF Transcript_14308/g.19418 Transcript_14308/m.19418 type:complete len:83 (+) Transcript_14308:584-832(+)
MKTKDLANQREEVADLEQRLSGKTSELRSVKSQLQVLQTRFDEAQQEIENFNLGVNLRRSKADPAQAQELEQAKKEAREIRD